MAVIAEFDADEVPPKAEPSGGFFDSNEAEAEFRAFLAQFEDVEFWDYNRFQTKLWDAGLPSLPVRLLEEVDLIWVLPELDLEEYTGTWKNFEDTTKDSV